MGITDQLVKFRTTEVPEPAAAMMRLSLFDWAACGIAGADLPSFAGFRRAQMVEEGPAHIFGGDASGAAMAALVNGTLSHALDLDDRHFAHQGRPSVAIWPAVMALAETVDASLSAAIDAACVGAEASVVIGMWLGRGHDRLGFDPTATAGAFGAALAAARLLNLDRSQTRHALGLCASNAAGLSAQTGTMGRALNAGLAARTGVEAALWAQTGMTAAADGLQSFGDAHGGEAAEVKPPRKEWQIDSISHQFHICNHGLHGVIEALSTLQIEAERIEAIKIRTHPHWVEICNKPNPKRGRDVPFSFGHIGAMVLLGHPTNRLEGFSDDIARNKEITTLRKKFEVVADEGLSETQTQITLMLASGEVRRLRHDLATQITLEARSAKLLNKAVGLLGQDQANTLWEAVIGTDLDAVAACFQGSAIAPSPEQG